MLLVYFYRLPASSPTATGIYLTCVQSFFAGKTHDMVFGQIQISTSNYSTFLTIPKFSLLVLGTIQSSISECCPKYRIMETRETERNLFD
jgi:hypothetical protein